MVWISESGKKEFDEAYRRKKVSFNSLVFLLVSVLLFSARASFFCLVVELTPTLCSFEAFCFRKFFIWVVLDLNCI